MAPSCPFEVKARQYGIFFPYPLSTDEPGADSQLKQWWLQMTTCSMCYHSHSI